MPGRGARRGTTGRRPLLPGTGPFAKVPPAAVFLLVAALFAAGVIVRGPAGAGLLGALALLVLGLLGATWRVLSTADRVLRVFVLLVLIAVGISVLR